MNSYKVLNKQIYSEGEYSIVPIRFEDRFHIMKWRNEQIYHLRQTKPLTENDQEFYFKNIVSKLFEEEKPNQLLFSYLKNGECIGYGGLVHINWVDKNAEISFIMNTNLEEVYFEFHWKNFLSILEQIAFTDLALHKMYTYAFDLRPRLYNALIDSKYIHEATLKEHCYFNGVYLDVLYHSKINTIKLRKADYNDFDITYKWAIDPEVRKFSFNQNKIEKTDHFNWFTKKINSIDCKYFILVDSLGNELGSIRIDIINDIGTISYLIDSRYVGKGFGSLILKLLEDRIFEDKIMIQTLVGYVLKQNEASIKIFNKLGYDKIIDAESFKFLKKIKCE